MKKKLIILILLVFAFGGCVKDVLYNTPHPDKGVLMVTTDWTGCSSDAQNPDSYILRVGTQEQTVSGENNLFNQLLDPVTYDLLVYSQSEGVIVSGNTATIKTTDGGSIYNMPDYFFSGYQEILPQKDDTLAIVVPMKQHIRKLVLELKLNPGDENIIAGTSSILTGVASAIDLTDYSLSKSSVMTPIFEIKEASAITRATESPVLSASMRLFGLIPEERQELSIAVTLTNGIVQTIVTDMTDYLNNFGGGEMEPLVLDATLSLPPEVGVSTTITDWNIVDNGNINVK